MEKDKIDQIIESYAGNPGALIHVLMEIQHVNGWLPKQTLKTVGEKLKVPFSRVLQVATFYKTFSLIPKGSHEVHVCSGTSCHLRGAKGLLDKVQDLIGISPGETDADSKFSVETGNCLGCCTLGPEIIVDGRHHARISAEQTEEVLKSYE